MTKLKKKSSISSPPPPVKVKKKMGRPKVDQKILRVKVPVQYDGQDPLVTVHGPGSKDPEDLAAPEDKIAKHRYPPPKKNKRFREKWASFIDNISSRENFNVAHLSSLEILCDLYVEYDDLQKFIRTQGRTYKAYGRQGLQYKIYPEVAQLNRVSAQIKEFTKMLDLVLKKDKGTESGAEGEEWE